jgi:hypothetical protein
MTKNKKQKRRTNANVKTDRYTMFPFKSNSIEEYHGIYSFQVKYIIYSEIDTAIH